MTDMAAIIAAELAALAADAKTLAQRLSAGDVVQAVVLPSNGLTDLLDIGGLRVAAELPPNLLPGETIAVEVVGFGGDRINLHVIGTPGPPVPRPAREMTSNGAPAAAPAIEPAPPAPPAPEVRRSAEPGTGAPRYTAAVAAMLPPTAPRPLRTLIGTHPLPAPTPAAQTTIEARLAAAHAALSAPSGPSGPGVGVLVRPLIAMRPPAKAAVAALEPPAARGFAEPAALLRALRLPVTAANVALAKLALDMPDRVPQALAVLDRALAGSADPGAATLATLASFLARIDPRSPVLAAQIAAFADHVVTGGEAKVAALLDDPAPSVERIAATRTALDYDLKSRLLTAAAGRQTAGAASVRTAALDGALTGALTALTAVQLKAAAGAQSGGLAFTLPLVVDDGAATVKIRVDGPPGSAGGAAPDAANFRLALELQTPRLGAVTCEIASVDRVVTVSVAGGTPAARRRLEAAFPALRERIEKLHFGVARMETAAAVSPPAEAAVHSPSPAPVRHVDIDA